MEKTKYRVIRTGILNQYHLQFLNIVEKKAIFSTKKIETWHFLPELRHCFLGFVTKENSSQIAMQGYGYPMKGDSPNSFEYFIKKHPDVQTYLDQYNAAYKDWQIRKEKDNQKPDFLYLN